MCMCTYFEGSQWLHGLAVYVAGIQHVALVEDFPVDKWNKLIAVNLSAAFHTISLSVAGMKQRGSCTIYTLYSCTFHI